MRQWQNVFPDTVNGHTSTVAAQDELQGRG